MSKKKKKLMDKDNINTEPQMEAQQNAETNSEDVELMADKPDSDVEVTDEAEVAEAIDTDENDRIDTLLTEIEKQKKDYLFLMAEFDNFRKRTLREKQDLVKNAAEKAIADLLPVVDDFQRAIAANENADDVESIKEGVNLIYDKLMKYLEAYQVKPIVSTGEDFDTDIHEAVTTFPAPDESQRGKVIDTVLTGYTINDKVLRHAKVVVGQ